MRSTYEIAPGAIIGGRYRLGELLGRGGMAVVYDGRDLRLERPVAVKLLRPEMVEREDVRTRFRAEARAAAGLSHPNAVAVFDTGDHAGIPYLVMERLPGETLADCIEDGDVDPDWLCDAAAGVLGALAAAHTAGIVHRDVKPGNILIAADGTAKIADFGIAKSIHPAEGAAEGRGHDLTATGQLLGTPAYLAPERIEGSPATPRSDLWALGVVLYEALTGVKPFDGKGALDVAQAIVTGDHVPLDQRRPDLDPPLVATIEKAMARYPDDRFGTAADMAVALRDRGMGADTGPNAPPADGTMILPAVAAPAPRVRTSRVRSSPAVRRSPVLLWVLLAALAILLAFAVLRADRPSVEAGSDGGSTATTLTQTQALANKLRDLAGRLDAPNDGARAPNLADGLNKIASSLDAGSPAAGAEATAALASAATWNQAGLLGNTATVEALDLLKQVPGVQVPRAVAAGASSGSATTPTTAASSSWGGESDKKSEDKKSEDRKSEDKGKDKDKD